METLYIRHKVSPGDVTNLPDNISDILIKNRSVSEGDLIQVEAPNGIFYAVISFIDTASVEVEILKKFKDKKIEGCKIILIQSIIPSSKFEYIIEKSVEIGITEIYPVISEHCKVSEKELTKSSKKWDKVIDEATEQSRNPSPTTIHPPERLNSVHLKKIESNCFKNSELNKDNFFKLTLSTEPIKQIKLSDLKLGDTKASNTYIIAIGPERGWSASELKMFEENKYSFLSLNGNILRSETAPVVIGSLIKFINNEL